MKNVLLVLLLSVFIQITSAQEFSKVEWLHSDVMRYDKNLKKGARRLIGNVKFKQDSTIMTCDSAYFLSEENMFEAFSNVHLYKENSNNVDVKSSFLRYRGDLKMAYFRKNVVMRDTQVVLYTDSLDYDIANDIGSYLYGATIVDSATTLTSTKGYYYKDENNIYFKDSVKVVHNKGEYEVLTDTLRYNTISEIIYFLGPTHFHNDTNYMYAEFGWYNTVVNTAFFKQNALYENPKQSIVADSLFYDRRNKHGMAYSNIIATDSVEQFIIKGNFLEVFQEEESSLVTDEALLISIFEGDSLFLHADTIITKVDTGENRNFTAYHHTKIFKSDFQAKTDSLFFSMSDSVVQFHGSPVIWADENQITAKYIEAYIVGEQLNRFKLFKCALIVSEEDSNHYNQVKGKEMTGYLKDNELKRVDVFYNSETIYFPVDDGSIVGVNKSHSGNISLIMKDKTINRIIYRSKYDGKMYPLDDLTENEMKVKDFNWLDYMRPTCVNDVFYWQEMKDDTEQKKRKTKK